MRASRGASDKHAASEFMNNKKGKKKKKKPLRRLADKWTKKCFTNMKRRCSFVLIKQSKHGRANIPLCRSHKGSVAGHDRSVRGSFEGTLRL